MLGESEEKGCDKWQLGGCRTVNCVNGRAQHCVGSPWKYSGILVLWEGKRKKITFCRNNRSVRGSSEHRGKNKSYRRNCLFLAQYTDGLQHRVFEHTGFPGDLGRVLLLFCFYLGNSNRIIIPGAIHASSRFPRVLLRDALGAMENTYKCM